MSTGNKIAANDIGRIIDSGGTLVVKSNGGAGISDSGNKTIIGGGSFDGNVFRNNPVALHGTDANLVNNILISIDADCIRVTGSQNTIGSSTAFDGNFLNGCEGAAITAEGSDAIENEIAVNTMRLAEGPGIDLGGDGLDRNDAGDGDSGPNNRQNAPEIIDTDYDDSQQELTVTYRIDSDPANSSYDLRARFFADDRATATAQGFRYLGVDTYPQADAASEVTVTLDLPSDFIEGDLIATATDADGNTSEFSEPVRYGGIFEDRFE